MSDFGQRVRERREEEGLSQEELADEVGLSRTYLSQIERGVSTNLSFGVVQRLSERLGLPVRMDEVLGELPEGLRQLAEEDRLPTNDVAMLARIEYRGQRPRTAEQWRMVYQTIRLMSDRS